MQSESGVVARIGEREITLAQVDERARRSNMSAYQALYDARRSAIEEMIDEALLEKEAQSRGVTTDELVSQEIESKIAEVTEEDVQAFYVQNQARIHGQTLEQIGGQIGATPAFFINGRHLSGAQPFEAFQKIIEEEIEN